MHNGQLKTIDDVLYYYSQGGSGNPNQDKRIQAFQFSDEERRDLVYFLKSI